MPAIAPAAPAIAPAAQGAPAAPAPVPFALGPSQALVGVIDFTTKEGQALFRNNTRCLYSDKTSLFAVDSAGLQGFLNNIAERSTEADWETLLEMPLDLDDPYDNVPFLSNYGRFDLAHIMANSETYVDEWNRAAQDNHQLVIAIWASLTEEGKAKIVPWQADYKVTGGKTSALGLLKVIIREARVDSNATTRRIREQLSCLDTQFQAQGYDVTKFNTYVQGLLIDLRARGKDTTDLLENLFKGYKSSPDKKFNDYIDEKSARYDEGIDIAPETLMLLAANKYKVMVDNGTWKQPSPEDVKILALEGVIKKMQGKKGKDSKDTKERSEKYVRPAWMDTKPSNEDISADKTKIVDGKTYWWCTKHGFYCQHSTAECRGPAKKKSTPPGQASSKGPKDNKNGKTLKLAQALQAAIEEGSESEDNEE